MSFKKNTEYHEEIKNFANEAKGEDKIKKTRISEDEAKKIRCQIKMTNEFKEKVQNQEKNTSAFVRNILFNEDVNFKNYKNIIEIYNLAQKMNVTIKSLIRNKLFNEELEKYDYKQEKNAILVIHINKEDKEKINDIIRKNPLLKVTSYCELRIRFYLETEKIFNFQEQIKLKDEAKKYSLGLEEFLILKIRS
ncbi:hypothetical protein H2274_07010 [Campylobacter sp. W0049]|uniref:hypothetical protein n=1 Tax=Campylobacter molothri TaxID=1032242 RepID=UPI00301BABF3|nr:hypothetical protein [Campylobacter sp. W0049]